MIVLDGYQNPFEWMGRRDSTFLKRTFVNLSTIDAKFIPVPFPCNAERYWSEEKDENGFALLHQYAFECRSQVFPDMDCVRYTLKQPGLHYVMWIEISQSYLDYETLEFKSKVMMRWKTFPPGTPECDRAMFSGKMGGGRVANPQPGGWIREYLGVTSVSFGIDEDIYIPKRIKPEVPTRNAYFVDLERFPHVCPKCKKPAYVGLVSTECSDTTCK